MLKVVSPAHLIRAPLDNASLWPSNREGEWQRSQEMIRISCYPETRVIPKSQPESFQAGGSK
jgi:hypothetical protein